MVNRAATMTLVLLAATLSSRVFAQAVARDAYADLPGVRLFYIDSGGSGVPVVFLHANTGSVRAWEHQIPVFTKAGYRFIAFDRRGWGRTIVDPSGPQPGTAADDLRGLLDHLNLSRVHVVSTAAGGFVALDFTLSFPERVRSLVVADSIGGVQDAEFQAMGRVLRPPQFDALPPEIREVGPAYRAADPEGTKHWVELEKISRPEGPRSAAQPMRNKVTFASLESIRLPVFLLTGGADMYTPPAVMKLFAVRIPNSESLVVPDAGHSAYWEQPDVFNRAVLNFIRQH